MNETVRSLASLLATAYLRLHACHRANTAPAVDPCIQPSGGLSTVSVPGGNPVDVSRDQSPVVSAANGKAGRCDGDDE